MTGKPKNTYDEINIESNEPKSGGIMSHIENGFKRYIEIFLNHSINPFISIIGFGFEYFFDILEEQLLEYATPIIDYCLEVEATPEPFKQLLREAKTPQHAAFAPILIGILAAMVIAPIMAIIGPSSRLIEYETEKYTRSYREQPITLFNAMWRNPDKGSYIQDKLADIGVGEILENLIESVNRPRPGVGDLLTYMHRGGVSQQDVINEMTKRGFLPDDIIALVSLSEIIPGIQDLISMAVRDAWNTQAVSQFGYDEDYPPEVGEWAQKHGLSADWTKLYWRAHWQLPSPTMGYNMLHRGIIDEPTLELLLRIADYPVYWRSKMIELSYNPITRVDLRRLYQEGLLDRTQVFAGYKDLGYSDENAELITIWTEKTYTKTEDELTKSEILGAFRDRIISPDDAYLYLSAIGLTDERITILLARENLKREREYENEIIENVRLLYISYSLEENGVYNELNKINPPSGFIEEKLSSWRIQRRRQEQKPSMTDIKKFYVTGIIDESGAIMEIRKHGYNDEYISWYLQLWDMEIT